MTKKNILVCGANGFIGKNLVEKLKKENHWIRGLDIKESEFGFSEANKLIICDLRDLDVCKKYINIQFDEVYQLATDMGGATYIFTGENDAKTGKREQVEIIKNNSFVRW